MRRPAGKRRHEETSFQIEAVKLLRWAYPDELFFHIPNGGDVNLKILYAKGALAGVLDLEFIRDGRTPAFIELKSSTGTLRGGQPEFMAAARKRGCPCAVCRTMDEFEAALESFGIFPSRAVSKPGRLF